LRGAEVDKSDETEVRFLIILLPFSIVSPK
jgi:hypothetical protein